MKRRTSCNTALHMHFVSVAYAEVRAIVKAACALSCKRTELQKEKSKEKRYEYQSYAISVKDDKTTA